MHLCMQHKGHFALTFLMRLLGSSIPIPSVYLSLRLFRPLTGETLVGATYDANDKVLLLPFLVPMLDLSPLDLTLAACLKFDGTWFFPCGRGLTSIPLSYASLT